MKEIAAFISTHPATAFYAAGFAGMISHYVKKWARGEVSGTLVDYLVRDNPKHSLAAVLTYVAAAAGVVATGVLSGMSLSTLAALGFTTGYMTDSALNKGEK